MQNPLNFDLLKEILPNERKAIIKVNDFAEDADSYVRSLDDATIILQFLQDVIDQLHPVFSRHPSLIGFFEKKYAPWKEFTRRENILKLIFLDDCLFPEKGAFLFGQDGGIDLDILDAHLRVLKEWGEDLENAHEKTQEMLENNFNPQTKQSELECQCNSCTGQYKHILRDAIFKNILAEIEITERSIEENIDRGINEISDIFHALKKKIDGILYRFRYRIRRGALASLESQVRKELKEKFTYPSELALKQEQNIRLLIKQYLDEENLNQELICDDELKKFFNQMQTNIWKSESYLVRELKKLVKSLMVLKRKDISGKILQDYIGEFWVHSQARTIKRKIIYHMGPTNSGKTYHAIEALCKAQKGCYLAPLRLLAAELFDTINSKGVLTTLLTGEEVIEVEGATHYSSTIEMARLQEFFDCCVIDEIQMITDSQRGWAWTRALVNIFADEVHICGDASVLELVQKIVEICGDELEVKTYERMAKLEVDKKPIGLADLQRSDALIVFSRRNALKYKRDLESLGFKVSIVYGRLSPEVRREQARKFDQEETDIIVSTDAIAMGMNLPIKRIVFSTLTKFIDSQERPISNSEIKQISGRAGRYQRFPTGHITTLAKVEDGIERVTQAANMELEQQKKCMLGPDLDIFAQVSQALEDNSLEKLKLSEFLRLFNTMTFAKPFYCVDLREMIEIAEMVEDADPDGLLKMSEIFGFSCAPVNLGLLEHVQYFVWILNHFVHSRSIECEPIDYQSSNIDYLETSIKCVELYQWLARHFNNKNFSYSEIELIDNKQKAIERLNGLLSEKIVLTCSSCGINLPESSKFSICEKCFKKRRFSRKRRPQGGRPKKSGERERSGKGKKISRKRKTSPRGKRYSRRR